MSTTGSPKPKTNSDSNSWIIAEKLNAASRYLDSNRHVKIDIPQLFGALLGGNGDQQQKPVLDIDSPLARVRARVQGGITDIVGRVQNEMKRVRELPQAPKVGAVLSRLSNSLRSVIESHAIDTNLDPLKAKKNGEANHGGKALDWKD